MEGAWPNAAVPLLSAADVARIDAAAGAQAEGGLATLMARAGGAAAAAAERRFGLRAGPAVVLMGPGMNGGDGAVAAAQLRREGREVVAIGLGAPPAGSISAAAREAWRAAGGDVVDAGDLPAVARALKRAGFIIDALFGVGLARPLTGSAAALVEGSNAAAAPVLAIDVPSGVAADTGRALGPAIEAAATISFIAPKRAHALAEGALLSGALEIADIGAPAEALEGGSELVVANAPPLFPAYAKRVAAHKYDHGAVLIASGGFGASGAARLAARAGLRIGAGLVTVAAPKAAMAECAAQLTAVMLREAETAADFADLLEDRRLNAVLIGPGHAAHPEGPARTRAFVEAVLTAAPDAADARAVVLDADALSVWPDPDRLFGALRGGVGILTPHGGEFARLFPDLAVRLRDPGQAARFGKIEACREAAARSGAVVLLKGFDTVIAAPDGRVAVQAAVRERAAPQLATAGSGDVLAGLIAGLAARGFRAFEAACAGAHAHLEAGLAAGPFLIAEDLADHLPGALARSAAIP